MVPQEIFSLIQNNLYDIEKAYKIKILFACESGSRGWGFASQDSDFDVRFIYIHQEDWYLSIDERKDTIEKPINENLDIGGWDIRKFLRLLRKSNAVTFEWLQSPVIYKNEENFKEIFFQLAKGYFEQRLSIHHYLGLATNSFSGIKDAKETKAKKYFYVIRPILAGYWIAVHNEIPPMEYGKLLSLVKDESILKLLDMLLHKKLSSNESDIIEVIPQLHDYMENIMHICSEKAKEMSVTHHNSDALNTLFRSLLQ